MKGLGFHVEYIGKPETLDDLMSKSSDFPNNLTERSKDEIQKYLNEKQADGGLILDTEEYGRVQGSCHAKWGNITLIPYRLKPIESP